MIGLQALISFWPSGFSWPARLAAAALAFPLFGGVAALAYGLASGYW